VTDFTQRQAQLAQSIDSLRIPGSTKPIYLTRCTRGSTGWTGWKGRKYIILIASGRDTFSKLTLDKILKKVKESRDHYHLHGLNRRRHAGHDGRPRRHAQPDAGYGLPAGRHEMKTFA